MAKGIPIEKLRELINELDIARSTVFVSSSALDHGETDLELQAASALKKASEMLAGVSDELISMCNHAQWGPAEALAPAG